MNHNGTFETESFKDLGISYLKGVLNTFASLNQPDSNLVYDYNIIKIPTNNNDLVKAIKDSFKYFENQSFKLDLIAQETFKNVLRNWLFETKFISEYRMKCQTDVVFNLIKDVSDFNFIYAIKELDSTTFSYNFGVGYDYFLLQGVYDLYLIYFNYSD